jgi:SAM-dependent methyltransferase
MEWQRKAKIQNVVSALPMADAVYYAMQRTIGSLKPGRSNPLEWFQAALKAVEWIKSANQDVVGKRFLEVGTGRRVGVPVALWLCGAGRITTVDLHKYLSSTLVLEMNDYMRAHQKEIFVVFGAEAETTHFRERFAQLEKFNGNLKDFLRLTNIEYLSPADAAKLPFADHTFDFHISHAVLEHVPADAIFRILTEARRLLTPDGMVFHIIDPSDHFAHDDQSITMVNFLQYSDDEWDRWSGNKFMYHNRLRGYEYFAMFEKLGLQLVRQVESVDETSLRALEHGFPLDAKFRSTAPQKLAVTSLIVMGKFTPQTFS